MNVILIKQHHFLHGKENIIYHCKILSGDYTKHRDLAFLNTDEKHNLISFDFESIVDEINDFSNFTFLDIQQIKKQLVGRSKKDYPKGKVQWDFWNQIESFLYDKELNEKENTDKLNNIKKIYYGLDYSSSIDKIDEIYKLILDGIESIYRGLRNDLSSLNELNRFSTIEKNIIRILLERTKKGIRIDEFRIKRLIKEVNIELYAIKNKLQLDYGIFSNSDYKNIVINLKNKFPSIVDTIGTKEYYTQLEYYKKDKLVNLLYNERKLSRNKSILTRIGSLDDKLVNPQYSCFGTITSRILLNSPNFQQLNKKYRDIILSDDDKELVYIDYSQFEAGILANESKDLRLLEMYNNQDIYTQLSLVIFENEKEESRDKCKTLFFLYCYGMSNENIKKNFGENIDNFFDQFEDLKNFRKKLNLDFSEKGLVGTSMGNYRYKFKKDDSIENWVISQRIQGNASLILKKAILSVDKRDKEIEFLIPMHDAVLYQIPKGKREEKEKILKEEFKKAFKEICPLIEPKVTFKKFTE